MAQPIVSLQSVTKRFAQGGLALGPVTLTTAAGDFVSLIGPSGCGKSTLLRLIAGLTPPSEGDILIDRSQRGATTVELAFVFQEPTLLPWLNVARNVQLGQKLRGVPAAERARTCRHLLELVRLPEKSAAYPAQLSGGQKMRVSLARAFSLDPEILLLDEPFGALDELTREILNEELLLIREQKSFTAFFVTHSVAEAVFLSNRVVLLSRAPGTIRREFPVTLPYPRTASTRSSPAYMEVVAEISRVLRSEVAAAA